MTKVLTDRLPEDLRDLLNGEAPAVLECGVVGRADQDELVKPYAFVVLKAGHTPSDALAREIQAFVRDKIAPYKYPRWIEFTAELPKTATGKIQRFRLRERLAEKHGTPHKPQPRISEVTPWET